MLCRTLKAAPSGKTPGDLAGWLRWLDIFKRLFHNKIVGMEQSESIPRVGGRKFRSRPTYALRSVLRGHDRYGQSCPIGDRRSAGRNSGAGFTRPIRYGLIEAQK